MLDRSLIAFWISNDLHMKLTWTNT